MKRILGITILILLAVGVYLYRFQPAVFERYLVKGQNAIDSGLQSYGVKSEDLLPPPLRGALDQANAHLTRSGTIEATNKEREAEGLLPLNENSKLNRAAELKLQDMFAGQYFEHVSPSGKGPSDLANEVGYKYVFVGENLALGNFKDDPALVSAWMNSPGHRANILNKRYQEIGVAVGKGMFEGRQVWLAVQEFGTPLSSCPQPSVALQNQIKTNQAQINTMEQDLNAQKSDLAKNRYDNQTYNSKIEQYNAEVKQFNTLVSTTKQLVNDYNTQISAFNKCLED